MKEMYELGQGQNGRFYIRGVLKEDGRLDSDKYLNQDFVDGTKTFSKPKVISEYLDQVKLEKSLGTVEVNALIAKAAGSNHKMLRGINKRALKIPKGANAYHCKVYSVKINLPGWHPNSAENYIDVIAFLRIINYNSR